MNPASQAPGRLLAALLCMVALVAAGCRDDKGTAAETVAPAAPVAALSASAPATGGSAEPVPVAYTPPPADKLYEMVAPIALYPDKLVAQVLAGATYPDQIRAAAGWAGQNAALKGGALADAAERQPWDPSVKSLTAFRPVLDQMAGNLPWTTALGQAYYNDPADVMNAIQVMRQRARTAGRLKSTPQLRVATGSAPADAYTPDPNAAPLYAGTPVVEPPPQFITIDTPQPDVVYVPSYDPWQAYGDPLPAYPGYAYTPPAYAYEVPRYGNAQLATAGALSFGLGVVVGSALERHGWGWNSWGMNWGRPGERRGDYRALPPADRPAVVYNRGTYVSRSDSVIDRHGRNNFYNGADPRQAQARMQDRQQQAQAEQARAQQVQQAQARDQQQQQQARMPQERRQQDQARQQQGQQDRQQQMQARQTREAQQRQQQEQGRQQQMQQARQVQERQRQQGEQQTRQREERNQQAVAQRQQQQQRLQQREQRQQQQRQQDQDRPQVRQDPQFQAQQQQQQAQAQQRQAQRAQEQAQRQQAQGQAQASQQQARAAQQQARESQMQQMQQARAQQAQAQQGQRQQQDAQRQQQAQARMQQRAQAPEGGGQRGGGSRREERH